MRICGCRRLCTLTPASPSGAAARHPELLSGWETNKRSQPVSPLRDDSKETAEGLKSVSIKRTALCLQTLVTVLALNGPWRLSDVLNRTSSCQRQHLQTETAQL